MQRIRKHSYHDLLAIMNKTEICQVQDTTKTMMNNMRKSSLRDQMLPWLLVRELKFSREMETYNLKEIFLGNLTRSRLSVK